MNKHFKLGLVISILAYVILNSMVLYLDSYYDKELAKYDLNNDTFFSKSEINEDQIEAKKNVTNDTARNLAPYTLIPISLIIGVSVYYMSKRVSLKKN